MPFRYLLVTARGRVNYKENMISFLIQHCDVRVIRHQVRSTRISYMQSDLNSASLLYCNRPQRSRDEFGLLTC